MSGVASVVEKHIRLSAERAERLDHLARAHNVDQNRIVEKALDILFSLTDLLDERAEARG